MWGSRGYQHSTGRQGQYLTHLATACLLTHSCCQKALKCLMPHTFTPAGNHLEAMPSGLDNLPNLSQLGLALNYYKTWRHAAPCFASLASSLQELELQHTASVLDDSAGFLAAVGQLTALTSLCAGSNQLSDLPEEWKQLKQLKVRVRAQACCGGSSTCWVCNMSAGPDVCRERHATEADAQHTAGPSQ